MNDYYLFFDNKRLDKMFLFSYYQCIVSFFIVLYDAILHLATYWITLYVYIGRHRLEMRLREHIIRPKTDPLFIFVVKKMNLLDSTYHHLIHQKQITNLFVILFLANGKFLKSSLRSKDISFLNWLNANKHL